jgi:hypothetical protein
MAIFWRAIGGSRTTGFPASVTGPDGRGNAPVAGERTPFCEAPPTSEDRRLMAMLGEYVLPPYTLVLRLPAKLPLPRPREKLCWFGLSALGMKMKDRSTLGKIYLAWSSGREILTGLSRLKGGRCCGSSVCCFLAMVLTAILFGMPGKYTLTGTLPTTVEVENDRFGGVGARGAALTDGLAAVAFIPLTVDGGADAGVDCSVLSVLSCRSCAHGCSVSSGCITPLLKKISSIILDGQVYYRTHDECMPPNEPLPLPLTNGLTPFTPPAAERLS